ncbi:hypothetical protein N9Y42_02885 [Mariniblastus sp.]|nr:hypothetical protein [Mariniblastus sp.]
MDPEIERLYDQSLQTSGRERISLLEEIVRLADSNNDVPVGYAARQEMIREANSGGFPEKALVAFSWCIAQMDKDPELDDWYHVIWQYKVIQEWVPVFARVSRTQITSMHDDMAKRLQFIGESERTAHYYRSWNFMRMGDYEKAHEYQVTYMKMKRGGLSDCLACEQDRQVELLTRMQRDQEALKLAKPIIKGKSSCGEVPEFTNAHICKSYLRLGKTKYAEKLFPKAYSSVKTENKYLGTIGDLMLVPLHQRDFDTAFGIVKRHLNWAAESAADELRFRFYCSCSILMELLANDYRQIKLRIPQQLSCCNETGQYTTSELAGWFENETRQLADLFNQRNGNDCYTEIIADNRKLAGVS